MARYRRKPVEVEAWQVGSGDPAPDWASDPYFYMGPPDGDWMLSWIEGGERRFSTISKEAFARTYEVVE